MTTTIIREPIGRVLLISISEHGHKVEGDLPVEEAVNLDPVEIGELGALALLVGLSADVHIKVLVLVRVKDAIRCIADVDIRPEVDMDVPGSTSTASVVAVLRGDIDGLGGCGQSKDREQNGLHC